MKIKPGMNKGHKRFFQKEIPFKFPPMKTHIILNGGIQENQNSNGNNRVCQKLIVTWKS